MNPAMNSKSSFSVVFPNHRGLCHSGWVALNLPACFPVMTNLPFQDQSLMDIGSVHGIWNTPNVLALGARKRKEHVEPSREEIESSTAHLSTPFDHRIPE